MNELLLLLGMMLVTFLPRWGVMAVLGRVEMPRPVFRALRFVPPAVLTAIIVPELTLPHLKRPDSPYTFDYLAAGIITALVAWRSKNLLLTIVAGMAALFVWRALLGL